MATVTDATIKDGDDRNRSSHGFLSDWVKGHILIYGEMFVDLSCEMVTTRQFHEME